MRYLVHWAVDLGELLHLREGWLASRLKHLERLHGGLLRSDDIDPIFSLVLRYSINLNLLRGLGQFYFEHLVGEHMDNRVMRPTNAECLFTDGFVHCRQNVHSSLRYEVEHVFPVGDYVPKLLPGFPVGLHATFLGTDVYGAVPALEHNRHIAKLLIVDQSSRWLIYWRGIINTRC